MTNFEDVLTRGMRREREVRGKTLEDVCKAAGAAGVEWDPSTLSRIETGKRRLWLDEFLALPVIMSMACGEPVTFGDLLNLDGAEDAFEILAVSQLAPWLAETQRAVWPGEEWDQLQEFVAGDVQVAVRQVQASQEPDEEAATLEVQRFAERLDAPVGAVMDAIGELVEADQWLYHWPRSERERRLVESGEDLSQSGRIRVLRGHITRQLEREIAEKMNTKEQEHGEHQTTPGRPVAGQVPRP